MAASRVAAVDVAAGVAWSRIRNSTLAGAFDLSRLDYLESNLNVSWKPAATWTVSLAAMRYLQTYQGTTASAGKTQVLLSCAWNGLEHVLH